MIGCYCGQSKTEAVCGVGKYRLDYGPEKLFRKWIVKYIRQTGQDTIIEGTVEKRS